MSLTIRSDGKLMLSINLGSGPLDSLIEGGESVMDDNWHSIKIVRKVQEVK